MLEGAEIPDCVYLNKPILIKPLIIPNPNPNPESLYLTNLDDQKFLRFSIKYFYVFKKSVSIESLKKGLSRVLVDYYPLAGRLKVSPENDQKLQVECNGEGALFVEAVVDLVAQDFNTKPNKSWRKLLYRVESANAFLDAPLLIVQATNLSCGGMIICTAINHSLCDGIGTSQFLHAWAHFTRNPNPTVDLPITPFHLRHFLKPRNPPQVTFPHPTFTNSNPLKHCNPQNTLNITQFLQSQPLVPSSTIFTHSHILHLKKLYTPLLKCSTFDILASHTWRCWLKSLDFLPSSMKVKLLFSVNIRKQLKPETSQGYYGNAFVLACTESTVKDIVTDTNLQDVVKLVQHAKSEVASDDYVRSVIDYLEDKTVTTDLSCSFVISQWGKLRLEDLDMGSGKAMQMGPVTSEIYCLFLPVIGDDDAVRVLVSMPESMVLKFENYMMLGVYDSDGNGGDAYENGHQGV